MRDKKPSSIRRKITVTLIIFLVVQAVLFVALILPTGIMGRVYEQSYSAFNYNVLNRAAVVQEFLNSTRSGFIPVAHQITEEMNSYFADNAVDTRDILNQAAAYTAAMAETVTSLKEYLNTTREASGVFIIMNTEEQKKPAVYLRDSSLARETNSTGGKVFVFGDAEIAQQQGFQLYHDWTPSMDFTYLMENTATDFFDKPLISAAADNIEFEDMFYWSRPFKMSAGEQNMITLTMPIAAEDGTVYAVCGMEVSADHFRKNMSYNELGNDVSGYIFGGRDALSTGEAFAVGQATETIIESETFQGLRETENDFDMYTLELSNDDLPEYLCIMENIKLYESASIFASEEWLLYGFQTEDSLNAYSQTVLNSMLIMEALIFACSIVYVFILSAHISNPIVKLVGLVKKIDPDSMMKLPKTDMKEIDELTEELEFLSTEIKLSASRLSMIVDMVGLSIGGFEELQDERKVLVTESLLKMFKRLGAKNEINYEKWRDFLLFLKEKREPGHENVYEVVGEDGTSSWYRMKTKNTEGKTIGFIMDITDEITEMNKVEYERDHDPLTKLLNRRAFLDTVNEMLVRNKIERAAMLLLDLDNLKYVNDTFGHSYGDKYIMCMADGLRTFEKYGGVASRMGGDEFMVFLPDALSDENLRSRIISIFSDAKSTTFKLPNGENQRIRFSTGISIYPRDSEDVDTLIRYADFAMYETKHNIKGTVGEFNAEIYREKAFIFNKLERLDMLIEGDHLRFALQPIADVASGQVIGYEALMRSDLEGLKTPFEILSLAKAQSKLYHVEKLCLMRFGRFVMENKHLIKDKPMFFCSIPFISMKDDDWDEIVSSYGEVFNNAVMELAETEDILETMTKIKIDRFRALNCKVAIGEFGWSSTGEMLLLKTKPEFVKISAKLIRDINYDVNKQQLVKDSINYCRERNIQTIAEGVETYEEMKVLVNLGVDYLKGFYLSRPKYEFADVPVKVKEQMIDLRNRL